MKSLTVDDYQRIRLPDVEPRTKFAYEKDAYGRITLTNLEASQGRPVKVRFEKRNWTDHWRHRSADVAPSHQASFETKATRIADDLLALASHPGTSDQVTDQFAYR